MQDHGKEVGAKLLKGQVRVPQHRRGEQGEPRPRVCSEDMRGGEDRNRAERTQRRVSNAGQFWTLSWKPIPSFPRLPTLPGSRLFLASRLLWLRHSG